MSTMKRKPRQNPPEPSPAPLAPEDDESSKPLMTVGDLKWFAGRFLFSDPDDPRDSTEIAREIRRNAERRGPR